MSLLSVSSCSFSERQPSITPQQAAIVSKAQQVYEQSQCRLRDVWAPRLVSWEFVASRFSVEKIHPSVMGEILGMRKDISDHNERVQSMIQNIQRSIREEQNLDRQDGFVPLDEIPAMKRAVDGLEAVSGWTSNKMEQLEGWVECGEDLSIRYPEYYPKKVPLQQYFSSERMDEYVLGFLDQRIEHWKKEFGQFGLLFSLFEMNETVYKKYQPEQFKFWNGVCQRFNWKEAGWFLQREMQTVKDTVSAYTQLANDLEKGLEAFDSPSAFAFKKQKNPVNKYYALPDDLYEVVEKDLSTWPKKFEALKKDYLDFKQCEKNLRERLARTALQQDKVFLENQMAAMSGQAENCKSSLESGIRAMRGFAERWQERFEQYSALLKWATPKIQKVFSWTSSTSARFATPLRHKSSHTEESDEPSGPCSALCNWVGSKVGQFFLGIVFPTEEDTSTESSGSTSKKVVPRQGGLVAQRLKQLQEKEANKGLCQKIKSQLENPKKFYQERPTASFFLFAFCCVCIHLAVQRFFAEEITP